MPAPSSAPQIFDHRAVRAHYTRAAHDFADHSLLFKVAAERLVERVGEIPRRFPLALELGSRQGIMARMLDGKGMVETLVQCHWVPAMLHPLRGPKLVTGGEALPLKDASLDLVISPLFLHWVNDLPGALVQLRRALKPGGLLVAMLFGPATLQELRHAWAEAAGDEGNIRPRISPFLDVRDGGDLLQRAGFTLPVADSETLVISYDTPLQLMHDVRGMGETNAMQARARGGLKRTTLARMVEHYTRLYAEEDGTVPGSFELVTLTGWAPE